jgi:hypothetical protein
MGCKRRSTATGGPGFRHRADRRAREGVLAALSSARAVCEVSLGPSAGRHRIPAIDGVQVARKTGSGVTAPLPRAVPPARSSAPVGEDSGEQAPDVFVNGGPVSQCGGGLEVQIRVAHQIGRRIGTCRSVGLRTMKPKRDEVSDALPDRRRQLPGIDDQNQGPGWNRRSVRRHARPLDPWSTHRRRRR